MNLSSVAALKGSSCLREALVRALQDEAAHALAMSSAVSLADIARFYDSLIPESVAAACLDIHFPKRILALELQIHCVPRILRQQRACGLACQAHLSLLAGSRHANNLARAVVYKVLESVTTMEPRAMPRAWFDDVSTSAYGSPKAVEDIIYTSTKKLAHSLQREGLVLADKSVIFSSDWEQILYQIA